MTHFRFLPRLDSVIVRPVVGPAMARADYPVAFPHRAREMGSRWVVVAVASFAARFSPETGPFAVVPFSLCRCSIGFATVGFVPAADLFVLVGFDFAAVVVAAAAADSAAVVAVVAVDLSGLSAADLSVVAAGPGSVGSVVFAAGPASFVCSFAVALGKGRVAAVVPFCFLTHRSFF